jgi:hypothetical protein
MKAIRVEQFGELEGMKLVDVPQPRPRTDKASYECTPRRQMSRKQPA